MAENGRSARFDRPSARTYGGLLREMASRYPARPALFFQAREISFRQMDEWVDQLARSMIAVGLRRGDVISVLSGNRPEWLAVAFAAARIGVIVAPMNTFYRQREIGYQLRHADVVVLFAVGALLGHDYAGDISGLLAEPGGPLAIRTVVEIGGGAIPGAIPFDEFEAMGSGVSDGELRMAEQSVQPEDVVFILYTSGSTALPKAVMVHHGAAIENDFEIGERQHLTPEDRLWLVVPLFYAYAAVNAVPAAWTHGASLVLQETFEAGAALALIESSRATVYYGQPHITRSLINHPNFGDFDLSSLEKGVTGHSPTDKRLAIEVLGVTRCCSMYGLTEVHGHFAVSDADDDLDVKLNTQGFPLPGWQYRLVDPLTGVDLPQGSVGELWVRGRTSSGYFKSPVLTAEAFVDGGWFKTGDLVEVRRDGRLRFVSRLKEMIKTGGINVAPAEVEELLVLHPHVRGAYVVGVPDEERGEVVVAFVEPASAQVDPEALRAHVRNNAASFKVPAHVFVRTEAQLPRGATGKVPKPALVEEALAELLGRSDDED